MVLYDDIARYGGVPVMWMVGHSAQKAKMKADGIKLAGETSGHIFYGDNYNYDDGLYAAVKLMNFVSTNSVRLSKIIGSFPKTYSIPEMRVKTDDDRKFRVVKEVATRIQKEGRKFIDIDGVRVEVKDGWWLIRASNTLPEITVRCESLSREGLEDCKSEIRKQLGESGLSINFE
jgi:phosphomannomutase